MHNKFFKNQTSLVRSLLFKNQTSLPLVRSLLPKILPLVGTCTHLSLNKPKAPPVAETPPEQMLCNECNAGGVSESIQGYKDMSNI